MGIIMAGTSEVGIGGQSVNQRTRVIARTKRDLRVTDTLKMKISAVALLYVISLISSYKL